MANKEVLIIGNEMFQQIDKISNEIIEKYIKEYFNEDELEIDNQGDIISIKVNGNEDVSKIEFYKNMSGGFVLITMKNVENIKIPMIVLASNSEIFEKILLTLKL